MKNRIKKILTVLITLITVAIVLIATEFYIRHLVSIPLSYHLTSDDEFIVKNSLYLNENNIYAHHPSILDEIKTIDNLYKSGKKRKVTVRFNSYCTDPIKTYFHSSNLAKYGDINLIKENNNFLLDILKEELEEDIRSNGYNIFKKKLLSEYDSLNHSALRKEIKYYLDHPINNEGFRSIAFDFVNTDKRKLLLLGDSFTYGFSAMPFYHSFADILLSNGNWVYNSGIHGTNVINYAANAIKYVPLLKPNFVLTFYFSTNDAINFDWDKGKTNHLPGFIYYNGIIPSSINNQYYSEFVTWKNAAKDCVTKKTGKHFYSHLFLYHLFFNKFNDINSCFPPFGKDNTELTNHFLQKIDSVCIENNTKHLVIVIPSQNTDIKKYESETRNTIFRDIDVFYPNIFQPEDYRLNTSDPHFNNKGHQKLEGYIEEVLKSRSL